MILMTLYFQKYSICIIPFTTEAITAVVHWAIPRFPTSSPTHFDYLLDASHATVCTDAERWPTSGSVRR